MSVYFAKSGDFLKIGYSGKPEKRVATLGIKSVKCVKGSPEQPEPLALIATIPGFYDLEHLMHTCFRAFHIEGEWFHASEECLALFDKVVSYARSPEMLSRAIWGAAAEWEKFWILPEPRATATLHGGYRLPGAPSALHARGRPSATVP